MPARGSNSAQAHARRADVKVRSAGRSQIGAGISEIRRMLIRRMLIGRELFAETL